MKKYTSEQLLLIHAPLEPCPFCGGRAVLHPDRLIRVRGVPREVASVKCAQCHAQTAGAILDEYPSPELAWTAAREAWEQREELP